MVGARRAGGSGRGLERGGGGSRVRSGLAPGPARRLGRRSWPPGVQPPPHSVPALVYAPEPGLPARLRSPPLRRTASHGASALRGRPAPSPLARAGVPVGRAHARAALGRTCGRASVAHAHWEE